MFFIASPSATKGCVIHFQIASPIVASPAPSIAPIMVNISIGTSKSKRKTNTIIAFISKRQINNVFLKEEI